MLRGMIGNALRFALGIFSGIVFMICCSETPAGVSEQLFHGEGRKGKRLLLPVVTLFCESAFGVGRGCAAMKAPVGLLSGGAVCVSRWRGFAPTSSRRPRQTRNINRYSLKDGQSARGGHFQSFHPKTARLSIGKIGKKCLHLGGFDDKIKML